MENFRGALCFVVCSFLCLVGSLSEQVSDLPFSYQEPPAYLHMCYKDDQDFADCFAKTIRSIIKEMIHGIPEMGIPPIEPLVMEEMETFNVIGLQFKLKDIRCLGASTMVVTSARGSLESRYFEVDTSIDQVFLSGTFEMYSPFAIYGRATAEVRGLKFFTNYHFELIKRNNLDFMNITSASMWLTAAPAIGELYIGGQRMNLITEFVNIPINARIITNTFRNSLVPTFNAMAKKFAGRMFGSMPFDVLVPDHRPRDSNHSGVTLMHLLRFLSPRLASVPSPPLRFFSLARGNDQLD